MSKKVNRKVPKLRFSEFEGDWKISTLEEIASISSGGTPSRTESTYWNGDVPWITTSETSQSEIFDSLEKITQKGLENSSAKIFQKNTILMAMYGQGKTRGQVSLLRIDAATSQNFAAITLKKSYSPEFVYCFLYQQYEHLRSLSNGNSHQNLSSGIIKSYRVPITSLAEQEKIASFLGTIDTRLTQLRRKQELLQTYKRGVMQKLFSQQIWFKQDDRSDFPEWEKKKLSDLFKWVRTNSLSRDALSFESGTIQNIHYGDIHKKFKSQFFLRKEEVPYIIDDFFASSIDSEDFCKIGDLVIADASEDYTDIGKVIEIIEVEPNKLVAGLHCFIARPKVRIIVGYSGYLFKSENVRKQIKEIAQGISVLGISKTNLEYLDLPYPCLEEQEKIADFLTAIDRKIETVNRSIGLVEQFKKGLLQKMFI